MGKYKKYLISGLIVSLICALVFGILYLIIHINVSSLESQNTADRWRTDEIRYSQMSAFISENAGFDLQTAQYTENSIIERLSTDSYVSDDKKRIAITNSVSKTKMSFSTSFDSSEAEVFYTDSDHFIFHPHSFVYGWHYTGDEIMKNYIVLNEELAFRIFGGTDVAGMIVNVDGTECTVVGVTSGPLSSAERKEWNEKQPIAYVMQGFKEEYDNSLPIISFEVLLPNPVKDYASAIFKEAVRIDEDKVEIVENTGRGKYLKLVKEFFSSDRSMMRNNTVYYPHWENAARKVYNDVKPLVLISLVFGIIPIIYLLSIIVVFFINKEKIFKTLTHSAGNKLKTFKNHFKKRSKKDEENY